MFILFQNEQVQLCFSLDTSPKLIPKIKYSNDVILNLLKKKRKYKKSLKKYEEVEMLLQQ